VRRWRSKTTSNGNTEAPFYQAKRGHEEEACRRFLLVQQTGRRVPGSAARAMADETSVFFTRWEMNMRLALSLVARREVFLLRTI
jgi:hypothetical protein